MKWYDGFFLIFLFSQVAEIQCIEITLTELDCQLLNEMGVD